MVHQRLILEVTEIISNCYCNTKSSVFFSSNFPVWFRRPINSFKYVNGFHSWCLISRIEETYVCCLGAEHWGFFAGHDMPKIHLSRLLLGLRHAPLSNSLPLCIECTEWEHKQAVSLYPWITALQNNSAP